MNDTSTSHEVRSEGESVYTCLCSTDLVYTIISILGFIVPLIISEILPLSDCDANGIIDGILKLRKKQTVVANKK
jgi:hypothetical protein